MKKEELKAVAELIGIAAIVASLIFVGLQMKQSQDIAIAEQYQARSTAASEYVLWLAGNESILKRRINDITSRYEKREGGDDFIDAYDTLGPEYLALAGILELSFLTVFDNYYRQYELGTMDDESWAAFRYRLKQSLRSVRTRAAFLDEPKSWRKSFQELCHELIAEIENQQVSAE
jgi:hypothetical protein